MDDDDAADDDLSKRALRAITKLFNKNRDS